MAQVINIMHSKFIPYVGIVLFVILFNLIAVVGLDVLLEDDLGRYWQVNQGHFDWYYLNRELVGPFIDWAAYLVMATSPHLIRGIYVVLLMAPLSCLLYHLYSNKLGLPTLVAFTSAIVPNILPNQVLIPAFINGSNVLYGLFLGLLSLCLGFHYLEDRNGKRWIWLVCASSLYFVSSQTMGERAVFLFPPFAVAFLGYTKLSRKHLVLITSFLIIALFKVWWTLFICTYSQSKPVTLSSSQILGRIEAYIKFALPVSVGNEAIPYALVISITIILLGLFLYIRTNESGLHRNAKHSHHSVKQHIAYTYVFASVWTASTSFAFLFVSEAVSTRYFYMSYFGLYVLVILSLFQILRTPLLKRLRLYLIIPVLIILSSGVSRYYHLERVYSRVNQQALAIKNKLGEYHLPENSQIVILGLRNIPNTIGWWRWSSGYLQFITKRKDLTGLIGPEYSFYDPFDVKLRGYGSNCVMNGLSFEDPLFLFRMLPRQNKLTQVEYALQWKEKARDAPWTIIQTNERTGKMTPFLSGTGWKEYLKVIYELEKSGISRSEIVWGAVRPA